MLKWTAILAAVACLAALVGFSTLSAGAASIARIVFFLFLVGFTISLMVRRLRHRHVANTALQRRP